MSLSHSFILSEYGYILLVSLIHALGFSGFIYTLVGGRDIIIVNGVRRVIVRPKQTKKIKGMRVVNLILEMTLNRVASHG